MITERGEEIREGTKREEIVSARVVLPRGDAHVVHPPNAKLTYVSFDTSERLWGKGEDEIGTFSGNARQARSGSSGGGDIKSPGGEI